MQNDKAERKIIKHYILSEDKKHQTIWKCQEKAVESDAIIPFLKYYKNTERLINAVKWIFIIACFVGMTCLMIIDINFVFMSKMLPLLFYAVVGIFALSVVVAQSVLLLIIKKRNEKIEKEIGRF